MGAQDFAHIEAPQTEESSSPSYTKGMVLTIVSVAVVLGTFMGGFWLGQKRGIEVASGEDKARLEKILREQEEELVKLREVAATKPEPKVSTTQVGELTFYNELPKQSAQPATLHSGVTGAQKQPSAVQSDAEHRDAVRKMIEKELQQSIQEEELQQSAQKSVVKPTTKKQVRSTPSTGFVLQVASFQQKGDAQHFLAKLKKNGFSPIVKRVKLPNLGVWHRVYIEGFDTRKDAEHARERLKKSMKITALVVKGG